RRTTLSALMLTTAGITFATARTVGSEAGSVAGGEGNGVGVCANKDCAANKRMIAVVDAWTQVPASARNAGLELRALPRSSAFHVPLYRIPWGRMKSPRK